MALDYELLARDFARALRGKRSQAAFSRRVGYRTNVAYMWEAGRTFPTAAVTLRVAQRAGIDVRAALERFYRVAPDWLRSLDNPTSEAAVCLLLEDLRAGRPVVQVAAAIHKTRFAVARWLHGESAPRLPDFFRLIDGVTLRVLDFVAAFVDPEHLPSVRKQWRKLESSRRAAYDVPWTHAVLRALELKDYAALPRHQRGWIAQRLQISQQEETRCLKLLAHTGQIKRRAGRWAPTEISTVDTRRDPEAAARLRSFWAEVGLLRAQTDAGAVLSFNLGTLANHDLERVRELHRRYFRELRDIISASKPGEQVLLANVQLVRLG
jgi:transcriptional regulator with XRE-family HTH domain